MAILRSVTPLVEPLSLDEAFLDVARRAPAARRRAGDRGRDSASASRDETGLTASVGVATTKLLAKIASDLAKPDGLLVVEPGHELEVLHPLPVERLWGVGPATRAGSTRSASHDRRPRRAARGRRSSRALGRAHGPHLHALAWNRDDRGRSSPSGVVKSIGHEETFAKDVVERRARAGGRPRSPTRSAAPPAERGSRRRARCS